MYGKNGPADGPVRIIPGPGHGVNGVGHQTVYHPSGDVTVLVGTGGPHQTVHHTSHGASHYSGHTSTGVDRNDHESWTNGDASREIDNIQQHKNGEQRGDQPGHHITPGQIRDNKEESGHVRITFFFLVLFFHSN